jgi:hypothetical protein
MLVQIATAMAIGAYVVLSKDAHQYARTHIVDPIDQRTLAATLLLAVTIAVGLAALAHHYYAPHGRYDHLFLDHLPSQNAADTDRDRLRRNRGSSARLMATFSKGAVQIDRILQRSLPTAT